MDNGAGSYRRFLNGDENAFDEIVVELFDKLVFFINRYVNDYHTAEDLAIDVFAYLIANKHRYNFKTSLKTYVFMLGKSRALNYIKHRKILSFTDIMSEEDLYDESLSLEEKLLTDEKKRSLNTALLTLPQDMQIAVHLVYFEDLSYDEAAKIMKKSRKQVDNLLYRAKKQLRIILDKNEEV